MTVELKRRTGETYIYSNAHQMRLNKLEKRKLVPNKCERCGREGNKNVEECIPSNSMVHHIDLGKDDHSLENLMLVCYHCHGFFHSKNNPAYLKKWKGYEI